MAQSAPRRHSRVPLHQRAVAGRRRRTAEEPAHTVTAARIATIAALVGALLAFGGALATATATSSTTRQQITAEDERQESEFRKTQQAAAYAQFLADEINLDQTLVEFTDMMASSRNPPVTPTDVAAVRDRMDEQVLELTQSLGLVLIIGSPTAANLAKHLRDLYADLADWDALPESLVDDADYRSQAHQYLKDSQLQCRSIRDMLADQARRDLNAT
jgi:hypothetical protein